MFDVRTPGAPATSMEERPMAEGKGPVEDREVTDAADEQLTTYVTPGFRPMFESDEHRLIGDDAQLRFPQTVDAAGDHPLTIGSDAKRLTYGQVVALGGDFYGVPDAPISTSPDPLTAFQNAYATLAGAPTTEVDKILAIMAEEHAAVQAARDAGKPPSSAYDEHGDEWSYEWNKATGGKFGIDPNGRYLALAAVNWDHFGAHAVRAYQAGHTVAMTQAAAIKRSGASDADKLAMLERAYAMNAFADHFLTDLFSSGHLRTPRKELYDNCTIHTVGSLLSRCMHDEDSHWGLTVHNANGETWVAYGDKKLLDEGDETNLKRVEAAVQASADEVWQAYDSQGVPATMGALALTPDLSRAADTSTRENFSPLFNMVDGSVRCRNSLTDRSDYSWTRWWTCPTTLAELKALGLVGDLISD
jgi:hypothetical protein